MRATPARRMEPAMIIYTVSPGDSVDSIAAAFQSPADSIIYINQLVPPYALAVGQALLIENGTQGAVPPRRSIPVTYAERGLIPFGYAYPNISPWVLEQTLPYLSDLHIFSYGFTAEGMLIPPPADDTRTIEAARNAGVRPILTLTPFGPDGRFNNTLISSVVRNPSYRQNLIWQLFAVMSEKGFAGVDVDFEYILADDRDLFTAFVADLASVLRTSGYSTSVALAPKTSAGQSGLLYEGKDYRALGALADSVLLMTYEWGFKHGPNMAVAPLDKVRRVVDYAVTEIAPDKISLGIPNYGYDWPLPFERGVTEAVTIGNVEAVQIAIQNGASIQFDETAQSPFFNYTANGTGHEVWFEDARSILSKFGLIREYGLRGAGWWQLMRWWRANWVLMQAVFGTPAHTL